MGKVEKLAIFDIDGTLHVTAAMAIPAYQKVMPEFGFAPASDEAIISSFGDNSEEILRKLGISAPPDVIDAFNARMKIVDWEMMKERGQFYPGVMQTLARLKEAGIPMAVCSMCTENYRLQIYEKFGIGEYMSGYRTEEWGDDKIVVLKSLLDEFQPERAVMVGDRFFDLRAARANGIPTIGCLYGYAPDEVRDAEYTVESADELFDTILKALT